MDMVLWTFAKKIWPDQMQDANSVLFEGAMFAENRHEVLCEILQLPQWHIPPQGWIKDSVGE